MTVNVDALVNEAINAHRSGNNEAAEDLLRRALEINEEHEMAWLWMSAVVQTTEDRIKCLEFVLDINPNNENARRGLNRLLAEQAKQSPFLDVNVDEWGDIDVATQDFMADLDPNKPDPAYRSGYESDFDNAILDIEDEDEEDFAPLGDFDPLGDDDDDQSDYQDSYYVNDDHQDSYPSQTDSEYDLYEETSQSSEYDDEEDPFTSYQTASTTEYSNFDDFSDLDDDPFGEYNDEPSLDYYFMMIPEEVRPTRVPGSDDPRPILLITFIVLLVIGNIALVALLASNMIA